MISGIVSDEMHLSRAEFEQAVRKARREFEAIGVASGDAVGLLLRNDVAFLVAMTALGQSGAYATTLNWQSHPDEIAYVLSDCGARAVLIDDEMLERVIGVIPPSVTVYAVGPNGGRARVARATDVSRSTRDWNRCLTEQSDTEMERRAAKGVIVYTSGTTGKPKGVRRESFNAVAAEAAHAVWLSKVFGIHPGVRTILCAPLYHSGPSAYARMAVRNLQTNGLIVLHKKFDAERLLSDIQEYSIGQLWLVPTMFHRLLSLPEKVRNSYDTSSLRWIICSAAHCPPDTKEAMIRWLGPVIYEFYGATETGPATLVTPEEAVAKPGTVGRVLPGVRLSIRDDEGTALPAGSIGEICCVKDNYPDFTYINREDERRAIDLNGEIRTGDVGQLDEDGYLFIRDRAKDMVIVGGVNLYPAEIESILISMPGVSDCAVLGLPNAEYGEILVAAVQPATSTNLTEESVREFLGSRLAKIKVPRRIFVLSELPRQDSGKILKRKLRAELELQSGPEFNGDP